MNKDIFYVVYSDNHSVEWNSYPYHLHDSYGSAHAEAKRLVIKEGRVFYIMKTIAKISQSPATFTEPLS